MRAPLALLFSVLALGGCAKFPKDGTGNSLGRLHFEFTLAAAPDPDYIYMVAIQPVYTQTDTVAATTGNELDNGPIPVVALGGNNGYVSGYPTRYVLYTPLANERYTLYQFPPVQLAGPNPYDPNAPVNTQPLLNVYRSIVPGSGIDPASSADGRTLGFDVFVADLTDDDAHAAALTSIQFNILTMNKSVTNAGNLSERVFDAIGDQRTLATTTFNKPELRPIDKSFTFYSATSAVPEGSNDEFNGNVPSLDIVDWRLRISLP